MSKICGICGDDCADRPRVKDRQGRYFCRSCAEARVAAQGGGRAEEEPGGDPYAIADTDPLAGLLDSVATPTSCPVCMRTMPPDARLCVGCGYDPVRGIQTSTMVEKSEGRGGRKHRCDNCGYELTGLREPVCPECGEKVRLKSKGKLQADLERDMMVSEWRKPAIWLGVGLAISLTYLGATGGVEAVVTYPIELVLQVLVGYVVLWLCFTFLGDLGTPLLNLLRLGGIYAVVDVAGLVIFGVASGVPILSILLLAWFLWMAIYIGLFSSTFEVDWTDALIVIFLTGIAKGLMGFLIAYYGLLDGLI